MKPLAAANAHTDNASADSHSEGASGEVAAETLSGELAPREIDLDGEAQVADGAISSEAAVGVSDAETAEYALERSPEGETTVSEDMAEAIDTASAEDKKDEATEYAAP